MDEETGDFDGLHEDIEVAAAVLRSLTTVPTFDMSTWKRTTPNENLRDAIFEPMRNLIGTKFNKEEFEAVDELCLRRFQAYMELIPSSEWPTE